MAPKLISPPNFFWLWSTCILSIKLPSEKKNTKRKIPKIVASTAVQQPQMVVELIKIPGVELLHGVMCC